MVLVWFSQKHYWLIFHWVFECLWRKFRILPNLGKTTEIFLLSFVTLLLDDDNPVENRRGPSLQARVLCSQTSKSSTKKVNSLKLRKKRIFFRPSVNQLQWESPPPLSCQQAGPTLSAYKHKSHDPSSVSTSKETFSLTFIQIHTPKIFYRTHVQSLQLATLVSNSLTNSLTN